MTWDDQPWVIFFSRRKDWFEIAKYLNLNAHFLGKIFALFLYHFVNALKNCSKFIVPVFVVFSMQFNSRFKLSLSIHVNWTKVDVSFTAGQLGTHKTVLCQIVFPFLIHKLKITIWKSIGGRWNTGTLFGENWVNPGFKLFGRFQFIQWQLTWQQWGLWVNQFYQHRNIVRNWICFQWETWLIWRDGQRLWLNEPKGKTWVYSM